MSSGDDRGSVELAVGMWYDEVHNCPKDFKNGCENAVPGAPMPGSPYSAAVGHFTAVVWKGVTVIGCAFSEKQPIWGCRYGYKDWKTHATNDDTCDQPNMCKGGCKGVYASTGEAWEVCPANYAKNVKPKTETEGTCAAKYPVDGFVATEPAAATADPVDAAADPVAAAAAAGDVDIGKPEDNAAKPDVDDSATLDYCTATPKDLGLGDKKLACMCKP